MSRIRGKNTRPELALRQSLRRLGVRYRSYRRIAGATVDVVLLDRRTAILVHGCFWHGCPRHYTAPADNASFWKAKLEQNQERDRRQAHAIRSAGWRTVVVWEHALRKDPDRVVRSLGGRA